MQRTVLTCPFEKIVVDHLPDQVTAENGIRHFPQFVYVKHCRFSKDPRNRQKPNYTVTFDKHESVLKQWAVKENHNYEASQK